MRILAIETSCDETGAAIVEKKDNEQFVRVLSNVLASSAILQAQFGGVIPEQAAREQVKFIIPTIVEALLRSEKIEKGSAEENYKKANKILMEKIDAIAVTYGCHMAEQSARRLSLLFSR